MTRCIGYGGSSPPRMRGLATAVQTRLRGLLDAGDPHGEVLHSTGTRRKRSEASTGSTVLPSLSDTPSSSQTTSNTNPAHPRSTSWVAPSPVLDRCPDHQLAHLEVVTNGPTEALNNLIKRIKRIAFGFSATSRTTESAPFSTPGNPTGTSSPPSLPTEIRRAGLVRLLGYFSSSCGERLTKLLMAISPAWSGPLVGS